MWKWLVGAVVVLLAGCVGTGVYMEKTGKLKEFQEKFNPALKPKPVRLAAVERGDVVKRVSAPGQIEPKTNVEVSAQVSARIVALPFRAGDMVKAGDAVVRLDARDLAALLDSAKSQLRAEEARLSGARANLENAQTERARRRQLARSNDISQSELEQAETEYLRAESSLRVAEFSVDIARSNITRAEKDLDNTIITSPFDGIITALNAEVGETVVVGTLNNPGSVILEIADLSVMLLRARVDEANIEPVKEGQKARVFVNALGETPLTGTVERVGLKRLVDRDQTAYFEAEILVDKPRDLLLRSGMTANAEIEVDTLRDVVKAPSQAVVDRRLDDLPASMLSSPLIDRSKRFARVVFTMVDGKAQAVPVEVGASDLTHTVIKNGLEPGATIVIGPYKSLIELKAGDRVIDERQVELEKQQSRAKKEAPAGEPAKPEVSPTP